MCGLNHTWIAPPQPFPGTPPVPSFHALVPMPLQTLKDYVTILVYRQTNTYAANLVWAKPKQKRGSRLGPKIFAQCKYVDAPG